MLQGKYSVLVSDASKEQELKKFGVIAERNVVQKGERSEKDKEKKAKTKSKKDKNSKKDEKEKKGGKKEKRTLKVELLTENNEPKTKKSKISKAAVKADESNRNDDDGGSSSSSINNNNNNNEENARSQSKKTKTQKRNERKRQVLAKLKGKTTLGTKLDSDSKQAETNNNKEIVGDNVAKISDISSTIRHNRNDNEGLYVIDLEGQTGEAQNSSQVTNFSAATPSALTKEFSKRQKPEKISKKAAGKQALIQAQLDDLTADKVFSLQGGDNRAVGSKHITEQHFVPAVINQAPSMEISGTAINSTPSPALNPSNNSYIITRVDHLVGGKRRGDQSRVDLRFPIQNAYYQQQQGLEVDQDQQRADLLGYEKPALAAETCSDSQIQQDKVGRLQESKGIDVTLRVAVAGNSRDVDQYEEDIDQRPEIMSSKKPVETAIFDDQKTFSSESPVTNEPSDVVSGQSRQSVQDASQQSANQDAESSGVSETGGKDRVQDDRDGQRHGQRESVKIPGRAGEIIKCEEPASTARVLCS
ncbi:hypothetical protein AYI69_g3162 [Smittium culicis]|uniref:Uncharacterized protein n=1 Tax=Smittium culicis TaxID=133412 RepID=A0A1R1YKI2_9FUNG|nr:hypothetical protein AYI69_g3162 [Smittium culicis]